MLESLVAVTYRYNLIENKMGSKALLVMIINER